MKTDENRVSVKFFESVITFSYFNVIKIVVCPPLTYYSVIRMVACMVFLGVCVLIWAGGVGFRVPELTGHVSMSRKESSLQILFR